MSKTKTKSPQVYYATVELRSDKKKKTYAPGSRVSTGDFPKSVMDTWIDQGILTTEKPTQGLSSEITLPPGDDEGASKEVDNG